MEVAAVTSSSSQTLVRHFIYGGGVGTALLKAATAWVTDYGLSLIPTVLTMSDPQKVRVKASNLRRGSLASITHSPSPRLPLNSSRRTTGGKGKAEGSFFISSDLSATRKATFSLRDSEKPLPGTPKCYSTVGLMNKEPRAQPSSQSLPCP